MNPTSPDQHVEPAEQDEYPRDNDATGSTSPAASPVPGNGSRIPYKRRRNGPCTCECATGGFCGGCGHAGCGRR
jgi:hypothetical protein